MLQIGKSYTIVLQTSKAHNKTEGTNHVRSSSHEKKYHPAKSYAKVLMNIKLYM